MKNAIYIYVYIKYSLFIIKHKKNKNKQNWINDVIKAKTEFESNFQLNTRKPQKKKQNKTKQNNEGKVSTIKKEN